MIINQLEDNMIFYQVPAVEKGRLGQNLCALINGQDVMLIDSGYQRECGEVLEDLKKRGLKVSKVIPSHYHPDHIEGIGLMDKPEVYGNSKAVATLKRFYDEEGQQLYAPTTIIDNESVIRFGDYTISFEHAPGHSDCSMLILINKTYLHLGDLYIRKDNGSEVLPYVTWKGVKNHLDSFDKILKHSQCQFLISHGVCPTDYNDLKRGIEDRKIYLNALLDSKNKVTAELATSQCSRPFEFLHWRKDV